MSLDVFGQLFLPHLVKVTPPYLGKLFESCVHSKMYMYINQYHCEIHIYFQVSQNSSTFWEFCGTEHQQLLLGEFCVS